MIKLLIRQKVFSWRDRFFIQDEAGNDRYYAEGEAFSWARKLHVYDLEGQEVAYIEQALWTWMPKYQIYRNGMPAALIRKEFTFFHPKYTMEGAGWEIDGSFWEHDYVMRSAGRNIATVKKEWLSWGDFYVLDVEDGWDEVLALAVVLTIDCVAAEQAAAST